MSALEDYVRRIGADNALLLRPPMAGISFAAGRARVVLHREGQFQAELILFGPHAVVAPHRHPQVESIDMVVSGQFTVATPGGVKVRPAKPRRSGVSAWFGRFLPIPSTEIHGGHAGAEGACIVSFQEWHGVNPSHIVNDWQAAEAVDGTA